MDILDIEEQLAAEDEIEIKFEVKANGRTFGEFTESNWLDFTKPLDLDSVAVWLDTRKAYAIEGLKKRHASIMSEMTGHETYEENLTWQPKLNSAEAYLEGRAKPYHLALLSAEGGETPAEMEAFAQLIVRRATAYYMLIGVAGQIRRAGKAAIMSAGDVDELDATLAFFEVRAQEAIDSFLAALAAAQAGA